MCANNKRAGSFRPALSIPCFIWFPVFYVEPSYTCISFLLTFCLLSLLYCLLPSVNREYTKHPPNDTNTSPMIKYSTIPIFPPFPGILSLLPILSVFIPDSTKKSDCYEYNWDNRPPIHLHPDFLLTFKPFSMPARCVCFDTAAQDFFHIIIHVYVFTALQLLFNVFLAFSWYPLIAFLTAF